MKHYALTFLIGLVLLGCSFSLAKAGEATPGSLRPFERNNKFGFKDETGKVVIEPIYDDARGFACGLAPVNQGAELDYDFRPARRHGGKWGYVNAQGRLVVPLTLRWAMEFSDGLAQVADEKGRRFIDTEGKTVITLGEVSHAGNFREGLAPVHINRSLQKQDWQTRCINKKGETVFTVDGYVEEFCEGLAVLVVRDEAEPEKKKYGYIDPTGRVAIAPQFAEALDFSEGLAAVRTKKTSGWYGKGDTWGYIDKTGRYRLEPQFNEAHPFRNGVARVHVGGTLREYEVHSPPIWEGGQWQLIDRKGNVRKRSKEWVEYEDIPNKSLKSTPVEHESQWWPEGQDGSLATVHYTPSEAERPFFTRLAPDEVATGSYTDDYDISTKDKKYVGWFGIVRQIDEDTSTNRTTLTVEHKYFDGLTDAHLQAVSFNGSGDFRAVLTGTGHRIPPLSLVKVYGTVTQGKEGTLPRINVVFVRNWHWGTFTFLEDYGTQRGSAKWRKANQVPLDEIYEPWPHPCHHYYEKRLGKRPDAPQIRKRLLDAAGPLSPEARGAMERLADLLAPGHTWSKAETIRQSEEFSQITKLVKKTGSQKAALSLLLQALDENDERVSWSATEKFAALDRSGDAVGALVTLLDHQTPRVRAGAACALWSGYGAKAAPAAAALSRCVAETDPEVKEYAILALGDIGPSAQVAVPALRNVLTDADLDIRLNAAKALWRINRQPDDVIPVFTAILENGADGQRCAAAERLKEMGPWAAPAVPALVNAVENDSYEYARCNAADALGEIGTKAAPAIPALAAALKEDESDYVPAHAVEALGKIGDPKAIPVLIAALENEDGYVRMNAVDALEAFGPKAKAAIPALIRALKNDEANRCFVAAALGAIDTEGISTPVLIEALGNEDSDMRRFAAFGLNRMGRKAGAAEKALHGALRDSDPSARIAAAEAYWSVTGKTDEAVGVLRSVLQAPDNWLVQTRAAGALAEIGAAAKPAVPELIACLKSECPESRYVVSSSAKALGKIGPDAASAVPALAAQLDECDDDYCRVCIAQALWRINRSEKALPMLRDALQDSRDYMAMSVAVEALGEMGPKAKESVPLLRSLLTYSDRAFRNSVAKALERIEKE